MRVERIMTREVAACHPGDTLDQAARIMWERDCGCVPVLSDDGMPHALGVLTDRDICMCAHFQGRSLRDLRVSDAMPNHGRLLTVKVDDSVLDAQALMQEGRVRRLLVVDDGGKLVGMLSLADLAREAARGRGRKRPDVRGADVAAVLASICEPTAHHEPVVTA